MKKRGKKLRNGDRLANTKLNDHLKKFKDQPLIPKEAFITLESEAAFNFILDAQTIPLFGHQTKVREATSPNNIIFEHRDQTWRNMLPKIIRMFCVIMFMFLVTVVVALKISADADELEPQENKKCPFVQAAFSESPAEFRKMAEREYRFQEEKSELFLLQCFCEIDLKNLSFDPICKDFLSNKITAQIYTLLISWIVIFVNILLRIASIYLIQKMKLSTQSIQSTAVMILVFVVQFANTAFLLLITSWNFSEVGSKGSTDFTQEWYENTGYVLLTTMIF